MTPGKAHDLGITKDHVAEDEVGVVVTREVKAEVVVTEVLAADGVEAEVAVVVSETGQTDHHETVRAAIRSEIRMIRVKPANSYPMVATK